LSTGPPRGRPRWPLRRPGRARALLDRGPSGLQVGAQL